MKVDKMIIKLYNLILDEDEADLLKGMMQNPLFAETPDEEDPQVKELRHKIFHSLEWKHNEEL